MAKTKHQARPSGTMKPENGKTILALPKGRILGELLPILTQCGIRPEAAFSDDSSRKLRFETNISELDIIRVRAFDVATFVAFGAAQIGVAGRDVLEEFSYPEIYAPVDLKIGACRLAVAMHKTEAQNDNPARWSHIRVATKYPALTARHFAQRGVQTECIHLNGAMEIAPTLGLTRRIVDLVSSGSTLKANDLVEVEHIMDITSRLIVNRSALKTQPELMNGWIERFRRAVTKA